MGTVYFNDGHTEPIIYYIQCGDDYIEFWTASGKYVYQSWIEEILDGFRCRAHAFYNYIPELELETRADIEKIELKPKTTLH